MSHTPASLSIQGSPSIDLDGRSIITVDAPVAYDVRSGGPQRRTWTIVGYGGLGRLRYFDFQLQTVVVPGDANAVKANVLAPETTAISAWNTNAGTINVTTSDGQSTAITVDSQSVLSVEGPSRDGSGGLSSSQRLTTTIQPFGKTIALVPAA